MAAKVRIALDAMGGDFGPSVTVSGAAFTLARKPDARFLLFGKEAELAAELEKHPRLKDSAEIRHAEVSIKMTDKPSQALRAGRRDSSMWLALDAVRKGEADAAISAGNTGALMAMAKICLRTVAPIERPAIAAMWPTARGESIVLDVGASIGADAQHIVDMAIMGAAMAQIVLGIARPSVGLLNVGVEEIKGLEEIRAAGRVLREADLPNLEYIGFVEGNDIGFGRADVVVTEGFSGNIALKTAEGTARQISQHLRAAISESLRAKIGYFFARQAFESLKTKMDPRKTSGGVFLGLDGIVVKSHGGANALGFGGAVEIAYDMVRHGLLGKIRDATVLSHDLRSAAQGERPSRAKAHS